MNLFKPISLLFLMALLVNSCKEYTVHDIETVFKGRVTNYYTGESVGAIALSIEREYVRTGFDFLKGNSLDVYTPFDTISAHQDGSFNYSFLAESKYHYRIVPLLGNGYAPAMPNGSIPCTTINLKVKPLVSLTLSLKNETKAADEIKIGGYARDASQYFLDTSIIGTSVNTVLSYEIAPEAAYTFNWSLYNNGSLLKNADTTFSSGKGNYQLTITY